MMEKADISLIFSLVGILIGILGSVLVAFLNHLSKKEVETEVKRLGAELEKQNAKQSTYIQKTHNLIESGLEILAKIIFNKIILSNNPQDKPARDNLFLLQKDALVVESNLVIYAPLEISGAFFDFKVYILGIPENEFKTKWAEIYKTGNNYLMKCRSVLGIAIEENFGDFIEKLKTPSVPESMGILTAELSSTGETIVRKVQIIQEK